MQADSRSYILPLANKDVGSTRVHVYEQSESNKQNKHCWAKDWDEKQSASSQEREGTET